MDIVSFLVFIHIKRYYVIRGRETLRDSREAAFYFKTPFGGKNSVKIQIFMGNPQETKMLQRAHE